MNDNYLSFLVDHAPEVILTLTSVLVLFVDFALIRRRSLPLRSGVSAAIAILGCIASGLWTVYPPIRGSFPFEHPIHICLLIVVGCVLLLSTANTFTEHPAEFNFLILISTIGMLILMDAADLLTFFLSLELLSLSLYALTAFHKNNPRSSEAALKYFLFGGISAAFLLFGFSFLYGASGQIYFRTIYQVTVYTPHSPFLMLGLVCTLIGFGFKTAAAPFQFWAPDVYEGAPAPAAAFIASASKIASFIAFFSIFSWHFHHIRGSAAWGHMHSGSEPILAAFAVLSMVLGNLAALRQTHLRRLIAYSAVAHTGYIMLAFVARYTGGAALCYYVITYALGTVGVFAIISAIETVDGNDALENFNGLARRSPILATCLFVFVLSLAGIPPLSGFFAKFYVFVAALQTPGLLWLVIIALAASAVALYYYLKLAKRALIASPNPDAQPLKAHPAVTAVAVITAAAVVVLGIFPHILLKWLS